MTYPSSLPHAIELPMEALESISMHLVLDDQDHPNGSSYAVDANARPGRRILRMSDASALRVAAWQRSDDPQAWLDQAGIDLRYERG